MAGDIQRKIISTPVITIAKTEKQVMSWWKHVH